MASPSRYPLDETGQPGSVVTPSQDRATARTPGVGSSPGARPVRSGRPRQGLGTHPCGFLSRTIQQTPVDGLHLGLQLRRHLPSSSSPALTPLPPSRGPRPLHSHAAKNATSAPGGRSGVVQEAAGGEDGQQCEVNLTGGTAAFCVPSWAQRPSQCIVPAQQDTEDLGPDTLVRFYRVPRWERVNNTKERKQSILVTVVILSTARKKVEFLQSALRGHCGSCSPVLRREGANGR